MRVTLALLCSALWIVYAGQALSVANFALAQTLGLQESKEHADLLHSHLELRTARWDLAVLWVLPLAGVLMFMDNPWWPAAAVIGGSIYVDTGGREASKYLGLAARGVRSGSASERRLALGVFGYFVVVGLAAIAAGLAAAAH